MLPVELMEIVFGHLTLCDVHRFSQTCRASRDYVFNLKGCQFNFKDTQGVIGKRHLRRLLFEDAIILLSDHKQLTVSPNFLFLHIITHWSCHWIQWLWHNCTQIQVVPDDAIYARAFFNIGRKKPVLYDLFGKDNRTLAPFIHGMLANDRHDILFHLNRHVSTTYNYSQMAIRAIQYRCKKHLLQSIADFISSHQTYAQRDQCIDTGPFHRRDSLYKLLEHQPPTISQLKFLHNVFGDIPSFQNTMKAVYCIFLFRAQDDDKLTSLYTFLVETNRWNSLNTKHAQEHFFHQLLLMFHFKSAVVRPKFSVSCCKAVDVTQRWFRVSRERCLLSTHFMNKCIAGVIGNDLKAHNWYQRHSECKCCSFDTNQ
jgi:hypothetical protein